MPTLDEVVKIAGSFAHVTQVPHFDKIAFKVKSKIFVTIDAKADRICVKLSPIDQNVFCSFNPEVIHPVPNKWGKHGWTLAYLQELPYDLLTDFLCCAYEEASR